MSLANGGVSRITIDKIEVPGFDISWAGWCAWVPGYCFGSEDGRVLYTDTDGMGRGAPHEVAPSGEAINGIAFAGDLMAVSTRSDVTFLNVPSPGKGRVVERAVIYGGAHGVEATRAGGVVAPMGRRGILVAGPIQAGEQQAKVLGPADEDLDFYRVISLAGPGHGEILACAARQSGFAAMSLSAGGPGHFGKKLKPEGVDFVDVAPLAVDGHPFAVAALGRDCSIHFVRDLSNVMAAKTLRFGGLNEQAYRILCAEGHMILLTDKTLYVFIDLASRFLAGEAIDSPAAPRGFRLDAVDASLAPDGSLLVVMTDSVYRMRIDSLVADRRMTNQSRASSRSDWDEEMRSMDVGNPSWGPSDSPMWEQMGKWELAPVA